MCLLYLGNIEKAIRDYTKCISLLPEVKYLKAGVLRSDNIAINHLSNLCTVLSNRSGLYKVLGKTKLALADINLAIELAPTNVNFKKTRSLMFREKGNYYEAVKDLIASRPIKVGGGTGHHLEDGDLNETSVFSSIASVISKDTNLPGIDRKKKGKSKKVPAVSKKLSFFDPREASMDRLSIALSKNGYTRTAGDLIHIANFIRGIKLFETFSIKDEDVIMKAARKVTLHKFMKGEFVFREGEKGDYFYIVLDGILICIH